MGRSFSLVGQCPTPTCKIPFPPSAAPSSSARVPRRGIHVCIRDAEICPVRQPRTMRLLLSGPLPSEAEL